ncbi:flagellar hook-associated protein FlgL [Halomonas sp. FeN2]|uniref:Flagellar hook-associated protein FlgL n=1 Tax=Vreelandella neptunia TaxID=115551 RepID=A0ABZ0YLY9_9GAMM|nr:MULTISPECIES: flagellar hook-associated protein FlgL [Halomonas]TDV89865.1 flagellar hook-associated protein 3 FlgL [Halomonas alkaliantarctica]MBF59006.1 flagellar hook-associated protein 3 [Halomonas sp.]MDN3562431.1 flagellar hook-associated protein FlgL [Halomonas neptunia]UBR48102.1 flagellar hook-associated protein FlgL [Halomonas sp. FeN2]WQH12968.1 flagellar hook-associated protein FlgL [Halomonas neptunia]|tara:strand:- start:4678 stop:5940 length:1263 start_codon:yes stop_codon:yes gene_type:complete
MRISSVTMFETSTASLNRQQSDFLKISQQIASGRRVVNPSDDPQSASRAVGVDQAKAVTEQFRDSRVSARNSLSQSESIMNSVTDAVISAKTLLVQASSDTLSDVDRESIASELKGLYESLIGQANATDGNGRYLFGGYKDNAPPFVKAADGTVQYQGDNNVREQRVDASRLMPVNDNGITIFKSVPSSAGYVAEATKDDGSPNSGNVTFRGPQVTDVNDADYGTDFRITFTSDDTFNVETFDGTNWTAVPAQTSVAYTGNIGDSAQQVSFAGVTIELEGTPVGGVNGDSILVAQAGGEQREPNLFRTMEQAIRVLENPADNPAKKADLRNTLNTSMRDLDNALDNVLTVRASAGARLNELDVVDAVGSNRMLNYTQTLSDLVDLDYADAISEYSLRQVGMQAAQKAFVDIKGLSLFNYM